MRADAELLTLFLLVLADSLGVPSPGDSALLVAGALAAEGELSPFAVVAVGTVAAVLGDTVAFFAGRHGARRLLLRDGWAAAQRRRAMERADGVFAAYGMPAVFFGKFIPGVRGVTAVAAGTSGMRWPLFALVNAMACLAWTSTAVAIGFAIGPVGVVVLIAALVVGSGVVLVMRRRRRQRQVDEATESVTSS